MCGICCVYAYTGESRAERQEAVRMRDAMTSRGPDAAGMWLTQDGRLAMGHRRLSIIDLSDAARQPMLSDDSQSAIAYNGEIYNYRHLRQSLEAKGHCFRTRSDTEVLLRLYAEKGDRMVDDLRGMFAFSLWDARRQALLLARDPYGIKPLYYSNDGAVLRVASQVKALTASGRVSATPDSAGLVGFLMFGSVPEPFTIYRDIKALPAGSVLWADSAGVRDPKRYFSVGHAYRQAEESAMQLNAEDLQAAIRDALLDSVRHHLVADVPVGAFLSAGVDSGALVGLMRDAGQQEIQTITLSFDEFRNMAQDEAPLATEIATLYGTRHTNRVVTEQEFHDDLPRILGAMDQPSIDGINTWFVSKAAKEAGLKVAISGLGGDELFGGYSSFRDIPRCVRWARLPSRLPFAAGAFKTVASAVSAVYPRLSPKTAGLLTYGGSYEGAYLLRRAVFMPWELRALVDADMVAEGLQRLAPLGGDEAGDSGPRTSFAKVASLEAALYMRNQLLRDTDWASMAHSLEVRVPLVDATLLRRVAPMIVGARHLDGKALLGRSPSRPLPKHVIRRQKTGFSTPIAGWLQRPSPNSPMPAPRSGNRGSWARRWALQMLAPLTQ